MPTLAWGMIPKALDISRIASFSLHLVRTASAAIIDTEAKSLVGRSLALLEYIMVPIFRVEFHLRETRRVYRRVDIRTDIPSHNKGTCCWCVERTNYGSDAPRLCSQSSAGDSVVWISMAGHAISWESYERMTAVCHSYVYGIAWAVASLMNQIAGEPL